MTTVGCHVGHYWYCIQSEGLLWCSVQSVGDSSVSCCSVLLFITLTELCWCRTCPEMPAGLPAFCAVFPILCEDSTFLLCQGFLVMNFSLSSWVTCKKISRPHSTHYCKPTLLHVSKTDRRHVTDRRCFMVASGTALHSSLSRCFLHTFAVQP